MDFEDLLDWKNEYYPSAYEENSEVTNRDTSLEISEILSEWYLESYSIKIPISNSQMKTSNFHHIGVKRVWTTLPRFFSLLSNNCYVMQIDLRFLET